MSELLADSLAHATLDGTWMGKPASATFAALDATLELHGYAFACAMGMWGMDGYDAEAYAAACQPYARLVPVAGFKPERSQTLRGELTRLRELGYRGIKLHPRFSRLDIADPLIGKTMEIAGQLGLVVFWCTLLHTTIDEWQEADPLLTLVRQLKAAPSARVILLHGGDVDLMRYMQLVRFNDRLLLDLSHTIAKYPGSSLELDIQYLFRHFDQRLCLGTDWPQFSHAQLRGLYERFSEGLEEGKRVNIAHGNLARFLGVG
ncbi:amidohydrolase family protein [Verrucomicrobium sp. BvORR106]|uniref:amidohydrolase family protein n=1 Tax=Verrucomicrobium sp. BvORR106 TaxID=1403819 RepID=UPI00056FA0F9|nr:amidohydrolase family protein [Verrucomicrobium sp. BvORR106]